MTSCLDSSPSTQVCALSPHQHTVALTTWIQTVLHVGSQLSVPYHTGLYERLVLLTDLLPRWQTPYVYGQFLLPASTQSSLPDSLKQRSRQQAADLGSQGVLAVCDAQKIQNIGHLSDELFVHMVKSGTLHQEDSLISPCPDPSLPAAVGFTYFFYLKQPQKALFYYKIASMDPDIPERIPFFATTLVTGSLLPSQ